MKLNSNQMTSDVSTSFGLPVCGHAFATATDFGFGTTTVVRERKAVEAGMRLAIAYVPGTSAWRPPSS